MAGARPTHGRLASSEIGRILVRAWPGDFAVEKSGRLPPLGQRSIWPWAAPGS